MTGPTRETSQYYQNLIYTGDSAGIIKVWKIPNPKDFENNYDTHLEYMM